jgi:uncharacterized protein (TIGR03437 family)
VNVASFQAGQGFAPGSYIVIYGRGLSESTAGFRTGYLPLSLAGVSVSFDVPSLNRTSYPGRVYYVSDSQINVQVPWELQGVSTARIKVSVGESSTSAVDIPITAVSPALFEYTEGSGRLMAAARDERFNIVGSANPVRKGAVLQLYVNGLGRVDNQPVSGDPSPSDPLARTVAAPTVTIGGRPVEVQFSGLAPGAVGLYQVNVIVPADAPSGIQPVVLTIGGVASKTANTVIE